LGVQGSGKEDFILTLFGMLIEFSIIPLGGDQHISSLVAEALKIVDASGLPYQLTPLGTCLEGEWEEVMTVVRLCHERIRQTSPRVITSIKIEDDAGATDILIHNVTSVEEKIGHKPQRHSRSGG
jgi:uncharacterized protein (TIGR00106 family)